MNTLTEQDDLDFITALHAVIQQAGVPVLPYVDLDGRFYVPSDAAEPGGTFFDVVVLPDDRLALLMGEVPGIGMAAAVMAGQVRSVLRAGLQRDANIAEALGLADVFAEGVTDARGTAAVVAVIDPDRRLVTYATVGHAGPIVLRADGPQQQLKSTGGGLLGTGTGTGHATATCPITAGDVVLLVSAAAFRTGDFVLPLPPDVVAASAFDDLTSVAEQVLSTLATEDSLCLLAARLREDAHRDLRARLARDDTPVRQARDDLGDWLEELRASPIDRMSLTHAAAELVTNAVEHGGLEDERQIELQAKLGSDGVVRIEVLDHGTWQAPSDNPERGRGLAMAAGLVDHLGVSVGPFGTRALLQHRLLRPVPIDTSRGPGRPAEPTEALEVVPGDRHVLALRGRFDHDDVERVAAQIMVATRGGTIALGLDLQAVTELSTSAVRLLVDLTSVNRSVGMFTADLDISATAGSTTERTLDTAGVPHRAV